MAVRKAKPAKQVAKKADVKVKVKKVSQKSGTAIKEKQTRIEILQKIAEDTNLTRVQTEAVFDSLVSIIEGHIKKRGSGEITIPKTGIKIRRVKKKATKARKMVSPLTGQEVTIDAKPTRHAVKISALKVLKEMAEK